MPTQDKGKALRVSVSISSTIRLYRAIHAGSHQLQKLNPGKANTKYSRTKLAWFNHSARKRDGLILQSTQKSFNKHISISSEMNIA